MMSNELDILIVGFHEERFSKDIRTSFRHWQVYAMSAPHALHGRRFRRAYLTPGAINHDNFPTVLALLDSRVGGENVRPFTFYRPEYDVPTYDDAMALRDLRRTRHPAV